MSMSEAIQILQQHERSRQGRLRASFMKLFQEREARRLRVMRKGKYHTAYAILKLFLRSPKSHSRRSSNHYCSRVARSRGAKNNRSGACRRGSFH